MEIKAITCEAYPSLMVGELDITGFKLEKDWLVVYKNGIVDSKINLRYVIRIIY